MRVNLNTPRLSQRITYPTTPMRSRVKTLGLAALAVGAAVIPSLALAQTIGNQDNFDYFSISTLKDWLNIIEHDKASWISLGKFSLLTAISAIGIALHPIRHSIPPTEYLGIEPHYNQDVYRCDWPVYMTLPAVFLIPPFLAIDLFAGLYSSAHPLPGIQSASLKSLYWTLYLGSLVGYPIGFAARGIVNLVKKMLPNALTRPAMP